jgi:hypothetical protein
LEFGIDTINIPVSTDKLIVCTFNMKEEPISIGGEYTEGILKASSRYFGAYYVSCDTIKPEIIPESFTEGKDLSQQSDISFIIKDDLSGIKSYNGYIDDKWVLFEYDFKNDKITYYFDEYIENKDLHKIQIFIEDNSGNISEFEGTFSWTKIG